MLYTVFMWSFFFFKQKTAYEMRISDWSSDVCSSDLAALAMNGLKMQRALSYARSVRPECRATRGVSRDNVARYTVRSEERRVGKGVSVRVDLGGRRIIKKKNRDSREDDKSVARREKYVDA